uniref:Uncharacterized protein n=1 Tax=Glossina morsitans morsitans TaxID=37546 RepID=A0A1B0G4I1_GLOMM
MAKLHAPKINNVPSILELPMQIHSFRRETLDVKKKKTLRRKKQPPLHVFLIN